MPYSPYVNICGRDIDMKMMLGLVIEIKYSLDNF